MSSNADHIISEVFRLTGIRISNDDPIMAVLLMQRQMFDAAFEHQAQTALANTESIKAYAESIATSVAKLETYREQLLLELTKHTDEQIKGTEDRVYASVAERVVKDVEAANAAFIGRLKKLLVLEFVALGVVLLFLVGVLFFKFN
ncbi:hypothetical protein [Neisseria zalophi]|nr:hypothetical protein [Neisseria zalophi]